MGKQGKKSPQAIQNFILEMMRSNPLFTQREIADRVQNTYGEGSKVDKSTVGRILRRAGLTKISVESQSSTLGAVSAGEMIRHRYDLRATARYLGASVWAYIPQLLEITTVDISSIGARRSMARTVEDARSQNQRAIGPHGSNLRLLFSSSTSGMAEVTFALNEQERELRQHLPENTVWQDLETWEMEASIAVRSLRRVVEWAEHWLGTTGDRTLAKPFAQTAIWNTLEELLSGQRTKEQLYRAGEGESNSRYIWWREMAGSRSIAIAQNSGPNPEAETQALHMSLRAELASHGELQRSVTAIKKAGTASDAIKLEANIIQRNLTFPGVCDRCKGESHTRHASSVPQ